MAAMRSTTRTRFVNAILVVLTGISFGVAHIPGPAGAQEASRVVTVDMFESSLRTHQKDVTEFEYIRQEAERLGVRVWLFGGTAAAYAHYVKWDELRKLGDHRYQPDRFDYDFTNIYR
ncbi:MAG: hypothetical protein AAB250_08460, partial [Bdellovibrionota bacterium]